MSTSAFQQGTTFEIERKRYMLLRKVETDLWQAEEYRTKRIEEFTDDKLHRLYARGQLRFSSDQLPISVAAKPRVLEYSGKQWDAAKIRRAYVMAVLDLPNSRARLIPVIAEVWRKLQRPEKAPPHVATVIGWKSRFLKAGRDITALIEQHEQKGNIKPRFPDETLQLVEQAIEKVYLTRERGTIEDTLNEAMVLVRQENKRRVESMQLKVPTLPFVTRTIRKIPAFDRYAARHGHTAAVKQFRAVLRHRTSEAPLARAEMDHTLLDLMVIDEQTNLPLGRPYITACIDDYTRCILGIFISFEPPSYFTVARCLKRIFLPKVGLREEYPSIKNEWHAHGIMRELVVDNGREFHSESLENACFSLGVEIHYAPRRQAWFKGKIERYLGTNNRAIAHKAPGTTFPNIFEKGDYDPSKQAVVRYRVLKEVIHKWICDVYHQKPHRALGMPPAAMWATSISPEDILVPNNPELLDAILGRSEERKLTHKGIELHGGLFYNSLELKNLRQRHGDKLDVDVRIDAADLGSIIVFSPDKRQMFKVPAIDAEYATGLSDWQHRVIKRFAALELRKHSNDGWLEAKAQIAEMIEAEFGRVKLTSRKKMARFMGEERLMKTAEPVPDAETRPKRRGARASSRPSDIDVPKPAMVTVPETVPPSAPVFEEGSPQLSPASAPAKKIFKVVYRERNSQPFQAESNEERSDD